jgi:SAM-dependent methyltransferase
MQDFLRSSIDVQKKLPMKFRAKHGIFLTPKPLRDILFSHMDIVPMRILEPTCGSGEFLVDCERAFPNAEITGVELNEELVEVARHNVRRSHVVHSDFLKYESSEKFDLIVGNPPFAKVLKKNAKYPEAVRATSNLYIEVLYKCLTEHLAPGGILAMIFPASIQNAVSFKKMRTLVFSLNIVYVEIVRDHGFKNTQAGVAILVVKNSPCINNSRFEYDKLLVDDGDYIRKSICGYKKFLDYDLKILSYNAPHLLKEFHSRNPNDIPFVLSCDLSDREVSFGDKRLFVTRNVKAKVHSGPIVFISRVGGVAMGGEYKLKYAKFDRLSFLNDMAMYAIAGKDLDVFYESLQDERTEEYLKKILGTGVLNIDILKNLPIFTNTKILP